MRTLRHFATGQWKVTELSLYSWLNQIHLAGRIFWEGKGTYSYDVCSGCGGEGSLESRWYVYQYQMQTRGGRRGSKGQKFFRTSYVWVPSRSQSSSTHWILPHKMRLCLTIVLGQYLILQLSAGVDLDPNLLNGLSNALGLQRLAIICRSVQFDMVLESYQHSTSLFSVARFSSLSLLIQEYHDKMILIFAEQMPKTPTRPTRTWEHQWCCRIWAGCWPIIPPGTSSIGGAE